MSRARRIVSASFASPPRWAPKRKSSPNVESIDEHVFQKGARLDGGDAIVERHQIQFVDAGRGQEVHALFKGRQQRGHVFGAQMRRRMVAKREDGRPITRPPQAQECLDDLAMAAVHPVEKSYREHERAALRSRFEFAVDFQTKTFRGAKSAPTASPTPTSTRE
jgi:hypothetical protein